LYKKYGYCTYHIYICTTKSISAYLLGLIFMRGLVLGPLRE